MYETPTTRALISQADRARSDLFEVRNHLKTEYQASVDEQKGEGPHLPLTFCDRQRATEAALAAAEESAKAVGILHRNLMTLLGYATVQDSSFATVIDPMDREGPGHCPNGHPHVESRTLATGMDRPSHTYSFYACGSVHTEVVGSGGSTGDWQRTPFCESAACSSA